MKKVCLVDGKLNKKYVVCELKLKEKILHHLTNFGLTKNTEIILLKHNYFKSSFLVKILNINYVVDVEILKGIFVYERNDFSG